MVDLPGRYAKKQNLQSQILGGLNVFITIFGCTIVCYKKTGSYPAGFGSFKLKNHQRNSPQKRGESVILYFPAIYRVHPIRITSYWPDLQIPF